MQEAPARKRLAIVVATPRQPAASTGEPPRPVCGVPAAHFAVQAALDAGCDGVAVILDEAQGVVEKHLAYAFAGRAVSTIDLDDGTSAQEALRRLAADSTGAFVILSGDAPLIRGDHVGAAFAELDRRPNRSVIVIARYAGPEGFGRSRETDADICVGSSSLLREALAAIAPSRIRGSEIVSFVQATGKPTSAVELPYEVAVTVKNCDDLAYVEGALYAQIARRLRLGGAVIRDGALIDALVVVEPNATIAAGVELRGRTRVGRGATVDVGCVLTNVDVGAGAILRPYSVAIDSRIGPGAHVGPFAHLRPESDLGEGSQVGTFVETKKTRLGPGAMAHHLAFLGDGIVGAGATVAAGTIFCNSDGFSKFTTTVGEGAFIGSGCQIVAPVTIGAHAYVATGTTVTRDVPADALAIGRARQENKEGYASKLRARFKAGTEPKAG